MLTKPKPSSSNSTRVPTASTLLDFTPLVISSATRTPPPGFTSMPRTTPRTLESENLYLVVAAKANNALIRIHLDVARPVAPPGLVYVADGGRAPPRRALRDCARSTGSFSTDAWSARCCPTSIWPSWMVPAARGRAPENAHIRGPLLMRLAEASATQKSPRPGARSARHKNASRASTIRCHSRSTDMQERIEAISRWSAARLASQCALGLPAQAVDPIVER